MILDFIDTTDPEKLSEDPYMLGKAINWFDSLARFPIEISSDSKLEQSEYDSVWEEFSKTTNEMQSQIKLYRSSLKVSHDIVSVALDQKKNLEPQMKEARIIDTHSKRDPEEISSFGKGHREYRDNKLETLNTDSKSRSEVTEIQRIDLMSKPESSLGQSSEFKSINQGPIEDFKSEDWSQIEELIRELKRQQEELETKLENSEMHSADLRRQKQRIELELKNSEIQTADLKSQQKELRFRLENSQKIAADLLSKLNTHTKKFKIKLKRSERHT